MSALDWVIVGFTVLLAFYGYVQGFIVGALSLVGFAVGAFLGTRVAPLLLSQGDRSPYAPLFGLLGALLAGGVFASGLEGLGARVRAALRIPGLRTVDGLLGAALTACVGLGIAWIIGAVALNASSSRPLRTDIQNSTILRALDEILPPSGPILNVLARFDPIPSVHGPAPNVAAPNPRILASPGTRAAHQSVVRVFGTACGLGVEGSGWVSAPGLVVTNAHVVAGETDTQIQIDGVGAGHPARALIFDPHNDIAILRVPGLTLRPLAVVAKPSSGASAAILGYPLDGAFNAQPGRLGETETVDTQNAYGQGHVRRTITALRGKVRPGNSGGPLVDGRGQVLATVFAALTGTAREGGFAVPNDLVSAALHRAEAEAGGVSTGPCAN
ncbi:MAG TPA: MarP family serine protease [Solirubrobacteraceae bacterium]|nr:MarP family serine protease [Solirubrobacteraceae bacterium]